MCFMCYLFIFFGFKFVFFGFILKNCIYSVINIYSETLHIMQTLHNLNLKKVKEILIVFITMMTSHTLNNDWYRNIAFT